MHYSFVKPSFLYSMLGKSSLAKIEFDIHSMWTNIQPHDFLTCLITQVLKHLLNLSLIFFLVDDTAPRYILFPKGDNFCI